MAAACIGIFLCDGALVASQPNLLLPQRAVGVCGEARHQREDRLIALSNFTGKLDDINFMILTIIYYSVKCGGFVMRESPLECPSFGFCPNWQGCGQLSTFSPERHPAVRKQVLWTSNWMLPFTYWTWKWFAMSVAINSLSLLSLSLSLSLSPSLRRKEGQN